MRSLWCAGLLLGLTGGVAMAQSAPDPSSPPVGAVMPRPGGSMVKPAPIPPSPDASAASGNAQDSAAQGSQAAPSRPGNLDEPFEGEIIQTPNGTYMVTSPGAEAPDDDRAAEQGVPVGRPAEQMQPQMEPEGSMPRPHPHGRPMPRPESKAAHFRIKGQDLALDVKCPDDEPVKACADAASELIDKVTPARH